METGDDSKKRLSERLVLVLALTLFTIFLWAGVKLLDAFGSQPDTVEYKRYIEPIPSTYNEAILDEFKERQETYQLYSAEDLSGESEAERETETELEN